MSFLCKKCKKAFRKVNFITLWVWKRRSQLSFGLLRRARELTSPFPPPRPLRFPCPFSLAQQDMTTYEDSDEYCPHCEHRFQL